MRILWEVENRMMTDKEILEFIESKPHSLIVMSGPTMCGKTKLAKTIASDKKRIITSETFSNFCYMLGRYHTIPVLNEKLLNAYKNYDYLIIEDIDMFCIALNLIENYVTDFITEYVDHSTLIVTGVDVFRWYVFWKLYRENKVIFITYCEGEDKIEKR